MSTELIEKLSDRQGDRDRGAGVGRRGGIRRAHWHAGDQVAEHLRQIRPRLDLLPQSDRVLIELVPTGQRSLRDVARFLNVTPGWLSRRVRSLWDRVHHPIVALLVDNTASATLAPEVRQVGIEFYLLGLPGTQIAERHHMPQRQVRQMLTFVRGWAKAKGGTASAINLRPRA